MPNALRTGPATRITRPMNCIAKSALLTGLVLANTKARGASKPVPAASLKISTRLVLLAIAAIMMWSGSSEVWRQIASGGTPHRRIKSSAASSTLSAPLGTCTSSKGTKFTPAACKAFSMCRLRNQLWRSTVRRKSVMVAMLWPKL